MSQTLEPQATTQSAELSAPPSVSVEIYGQVYHLRGVDPVYIERLASIVDEKMQAVAAHGGTVDSLRVAVLAALNIADELSSLNDRYQGLLGSQHSSQSSMRTRADSLADALDEVLDERRAG